MSDTQSLYDEIIKRLIKETALEQVEEVSGCDMKLYHAGQIIAYKYVAERLINRHGCKASFIETSKEPNQ